MRVSSPFAYFSSITSMENCCGETVIFKSSSAMSVLVVSGLLRCIGAAEAPTPSVSNLKFAPFSEPTDRKSA